MGRSLATVIVIVIAGCGGNTPAGGLSLEELHRDEIRANCDYYVRCGLFADLARCTGFFKLPDDRSLFRGVGAGKVRFDSVAAVECHALLAARSCDVTQQDGRIPEICNQVLVGQVDVGGACAFDVACASRTCLLSACPPGECCPGTCEPGERGAIGAACQSDLQCAPESFCGVSDRKCTALLPQAAACLADEQCAYGLGCAGKSALMDGTCEALPAIGSPCVGGRCADVGAVCNAQDQCVAAGLVGGACTTDDDCSRFLECGPGGTCVDIPQLGEGCMTSCAGESFCSEETSCAAPQEDGAFCELPQECAGRLCLQGEFFGQCVTPAVCF